MSTPALRVLPNGFAQFEGQAPLINLRRIDVVQVGTMTPKGADDKTETQFCVIVNFGVQQVAFPAPDEECALQMGDAVLTAIGKVNPQPAKAPESFKLTKIDPSKIPDDAKVKQLSAAGPSE